MKLKILSFLLLSVFFLDAQEFVMIHDSTITDDIEGDFYYYKVVRIEKRIATPKILKNPKNVLMADFNHNILIARVNNTIIHYNIETQKLDTLFNVFPETQITRPLWSSDNDKVAFLILNPKKKYNYPTPYRLIVLTLNNGKVIKKEKTNLEKCPNWENWYFEMQNFGYVKPDLCFRFVSDDKIQIAKSQILTFTPEKGFEPVNEKNNYAFITKFAEYQLIKYKKTKAPNIVSGGSFYYNFAILKGMQLFYYNIDSGFFVCYDLIKDKPLLKVPVKKVYSEAIFSADGHYIVFIGDYKNDLEDYFAFPFVIDLYSMDYKIYKDKKVFLGAADDYVFYGSINLYVAGKYTKIYIQTTDIVTNKTITYDLDL